MSETKAHLKQNAVREDGTLNVLQLRANRDHALAAARVSIEDDAALAAREGEIEAAYLEIRAEFGS